MSGKKLKLIDEKTFSFLKARKIAFPSVSFVPTTVLDIHFGARELGKGRIGWVDLGRKEKQGRSLRQVIFQLCYILKSLQKFSVLILLTMAHTKRNVHITSLKDTYQETDAASQKLLLCLLLVITASKGLPPYGLPTL